MGSDPVLSFGTRHCDPIRLGINALFSYVAGWPLRTSSDFLEADRPVLTQRASRGQPGSQRATRIQHAAGTLRARLDRVEEAADLGLVGGCESIDEVLVTRLARRVHLRLQRSQWGARIPADRDAVA